MPTDRQYVWSLAMDQVRDERDYYERRLKEATSPDRALELAAAVSALGYLLRKMEILEYPARVSTVSFEGSEAA